MATYSIYETKARLSEVLRLVKTRREVIVTERGKPIAKIVPFDDHDADALEQRIDRLMASGQLVPATVSPKDALPRVGKGRSAARNKDVGALQRFLAERDE